MNNAAFNAGEAAEFLMSMEVEDGELYQAADEMPLMMMDPDDRDLCEVAEAVDRNRQSQSPSIEKSSTLGDHEGAVDEVERGRNRSKCHLRNFIFLLSVCDTRALWLNG
jgi:hypothetical protein